MNDAQARRVLIDQQFLHDDAVPSSSLEPGVFLIDTDFAEAESDTQPAARLVLGDDAGNEFLVAPRPAFADQRLHERTPMALAALTFAHIDGEFPHTFITLPRPVL
jgi:hypothetical protein